MDRTSRRIFFTLGGLLVTMLVQSAVHAQGNWTRTRNHAEADAQVRQTIQKTDLAESIVASRESALGRTFDPAYRVSLKNALASLPAARLESLRYSGGDGRLLRDAVGDSNTSLIYTPVTPCRVFDTRSAAAGILAADTQRNFFVAGTGSQFTAQGGNSDGCGIPFGPATSVIINFVAVTPSGNGNLRAWAVANPQPAAPLAAVMNFSPNMFAIANGVAVPICDPALTLCTAGDLRLQADVSSVHVVGDAVGYFRKLDLPAAMPMGSEQLIAFTPALGEQYAIGTVDVVLPHDGSCLVTCNLDLWATAPGNAGFLALKTARRDVATAANLSDAGYRMDVPAPATNGSVSSTYTWTMTGGTPYRFGCHVEAVSGPISVTASPNVSWICR